MQSTLSVCACVCVQFSFRFYFSHFSFCLRAHLHNSLNEPINSDYVYAQVAHHCNLFKSKGRACEQRHPLPSTCCMRCTFSFFFSSSAFHCDKFHANSTHLALHVISSTSPLYTSCGICIFLAHNKCRSAFINRLNESL